jgi:hypothetical protein
MGALAFAETDASVAEIRTARGPSLACQPYVAGFVSPYSFADTSPQSAPAASDISRDHRTAKSDIGAPSFDKSRQSLLKNSKARHQAIHARSRDAI